MGDCVGDTVGDAVGSTVGEEGGEAAGEAVGVAVGDAVGDIEITLQRGRRADDVQIWSFHLPLHPPLLKNFAQSSCPPLLFGSPSFHESV